MAAVEEVNDTGPRYWAVVLVHEVKLQSGLTCLAAHIVLRATFNGSVYLSPRKSDYSLSLRLMKLLKKYLKLDRR
jgi:hypothetical protein